MLATHRDAHTRNKNENITSRKIPHCQSLGVLDSYIDVDGYAKPSKVQRYGRHHVVTAALD